MAEMTTKILTVELQADKAINGIVSLNDAIGKNTQQIKNNNAMIAENSKAMKQEGADVMALTAQNQRLAQSNVELEAKTKVLKDERRSLQKEIQNEVRANVQAEGSLKALRAELSNLTKQYDSLSKSERQNEQVGGALLKQINSVTTEIKSAEEETQRYFRNVGNYPEAMGSVKGALRTMQDEIINLTVQYRQMDEEMRKSEAGQAMQAQIAKLTEEASELKDAMGDVKQSIREGASDTRGLDTAIQAGQTLAATFGLAQNAAQALGLSTEGVQQAMLKMQQAMQAVQALQVIQNSLQKQSNLMRGIAIIQSKALAASEAIEAKVKTQATGATIAQTVAQKAFNLVAQANPYVLLATAILSVIGLVVGYTSAIKDNTEAEEDNAEAKQKQIEAEKRQKEAEEELQKAIRITTSDIEARKEAEASIAEGVADSVAKQIANYQLLQDAWAKTGGDIKQQQQLLVDYRKEFDATGFSIRNVAQANAFLVSKKKLVLDYFWSIAKAAAAAAAAAELMRKQIMMELSPTVENGGKYYRFRPSQNGRFNISNDTSKAGNMTLAEWNAIRAAGLVGGEDSMGEIASNPKVQSFIDNMRNKEAQDRRRTLNEANKKVIDKLNDIVVSQNQNAKQIIGKLGVPTTSGGRISSGGGGGRSSSSSSTSKNTSTPKKNEKTPEQLAFEAYLKRAEELEEKGTELHKHALEERSKASIEAINELAEVERQKLYETYGDRSNYEGDALAAWDAMWQEIENKRTQRIKDYNENIRKQEQEQAAKTAEFAQQYAQTMVEALPEGSYMQKEWQLEQLRLQMEAELAMYENNEQMKMAIQSKYGLQMQQIEQQFLQNQLEIQKQKFDAIAGVVGGIGQVFGEFGDESREMAILQKTLALGEIMIAQAVAIANAVKAGSNAITPWQMIAQIATSVTAVTVAMVQAFKALDQAKFATGGYIRGAGTGTSDSIPVRVSNGESIMNANTTAMFGGLLSSLNQLGGGAPIQATQSAQSIQGEDMLARAFAKGVAMLPNPVVSVVDINNGQRQVEVMNERATL